MNLMHGNSHEVLVDPLARLYVMNASRSVLSYVLPMEFWKECVTKREMRVMSLGGQRHGLRVGDGTRLWVVF